MMNLNVWKQACFVFLLCAGTTIGSHAQTFTTILNFDGTNGSDSLAGLVQGTDGNFYGTTFLGGRSQFCQRCGTAFRISKMGDLISHNFCAQAGCTDGRNPHAALLLATDGNFYGVTSSGGANSEGTVFKLTPGGKFTILHSFDGADGASAVAPLVDGTDGNLYGTTFAGGPCGGSGCGVFFRITRSGEFTVLHTFDASGIGPNGLLQGTDGNFYGTTAAGGTHKSGTVCRISKDGTLRTLYNFCVHTTCPDGSFPASSLIQGSDGNFYGTTPQGGINNGGTVFTITPVGKLTTLYAFCPQAPCPDGEQPVAVLIQGTDGNLYGVTDTGGANVFYGTVFELTASGILTTLHSFDSTDGNGPDGTLLQATDGRFYGTTLLGGTNANCSGGCGAVYSLDIGLAPFASLLRDSGSIGSQMGILGQGFSGTTNVSFNGTAASFTVVSATYLATRVPSGATSGFVTVTTPGGTLTSNREFRVKP